MVFCYDYYLRNSLRKPIFHAQPFARLQWYLYILYNVQYSTSAHIIYVRNGLNKCVRNGNHAIIDVKSCRIYMPP